MPKPRPTVTPGRRLMVLYLVIGRYYVGTESTKSGSDLESWDVVRFTRVTPNMKNDLPAQTA